MKVKVLLGTATIALVGFVGAVYAVIGQVMPDVPQTSVVPVVEAVEQPQVPEFRETVEVETIVTAPAAPVATEKAEQAPIDDRPEWRKFLDNKKALGGSNAEAVYCIDKWDEFNNAAKAHEISYIYNKFHILTDPEKNDVVAEVFSKVHAERTCAPRWIPG